MSNKTFAIIFFGVILADVQGHPPLMLWELEGFSCEIEWWCHVSGFKPSRQIYNRQGEFLNSVHPGSQAVDQYGIERRDWLRKNPLPFDIVKFGQHETGSTAFAVPYSGKRFGPYVPTSFDPAALVMIPEAVSALREFCRRFDISDELKWHTVSG